MTIPSDQQTSQQPLEQSSQKGEIDQNGKKLNLEIKIENDLIIFYLSSIDFNNFKGSLTLEEIISQVPALEDYNIQEVFEIINEQKIEDYSLIE